MAKRIPADGDVHARLMAAQTELEHALLAGEDTRRLRQRIADLQREIGEAAAAKHAEQAEVARAEHEAIADRARTIASEASDRFAQTLAGLMPPPAPL